MDENMTVIGDWTPPNPSPRTFMSNFLNEEFSSNSLSDILAENRNGESLPETEKQTMSFNFKEEKGDGGIDFSSSNSLESCLLDGQKSSSRGGLAQRMARAGFNAPTINTARIRSANVSSSQLEVPSPYLTIPPGLSPTTLLDSPVFLFNSVAQPSPTTGKISFASNGATALSISASDSVLPDKSSKDEHIEDFVPGGFAFKPPLNATSSYFSSSENKGASGTHRGQSIQSMEVSLQQDNSSDRKDLFARPSDSFTANENSVPINDQSEGEGDAKEELSSMAVSAPAEDGYNWRKYGQKQVKGSEYPRSYYKCTHPNCPVKKKVERSHEGHITEIIYKGAHNHAKPLPNRRSGVPPSHPFNDPQMDGLEHQANFDGMEASSSVSLAADFGGGPSTSIQTQDGSYFGSPEAIDVSSTVSNDEEEEDQATLASVSLGADGGEGDESESKRRKVDVSAVEMSAASRAVREPRVVVQTTSEVDILDDGYRWRKYGQKVVKGNPNPRSYYKCTNPGCTVRKHVERASHDLKSVITTYEGKHNHDVPAARNSHSSSAPSTTPPLPPAQRRTDQTTAQDTLMRFNGAPPLTTFNLSGREQQQLGMGSAFSFAMGQAGLANFGLAGLGPIGQVKMPMLGPIHSYMGMQAGSSEAGLMVPKGEPKESDSNGMAAYHQLIGRLPLGHQM